jgi:hypothetical protein
MAPCQLGLSYSEAILTPRSVKLFFDSAHLNQ